MRRPATSLLLAGALIASGGAFAMAQSAGPEPTAQSATAEPTAGTPTETPADTGSPTSDPTTEEPSSTGEDEAGTRTPPGWAKRDAAKDRGKDGSQDGQGPPGWKGKGPGQGRGPDATGPAAYGLCRAWAEQEDPAAKAEHVPPFRNLAAAAGGVDKVEAYCAALPEREPDDED
jgi:hypothetical protein